MQSCKHFFLIQNKFVHYVSKSPFFFFLISNLLLLSKLPTDQKLLEKPKKISFFFSLPSVSFFDSRKRTTVLWARSHYVTLMMIHSIRHDSLLLYMMKPKKHPRRNQEGGLERREGANFVLAGEAWLSLVA